MTRRKNGTWQQSMTVIVNGRKVQKYFYGKTKSEVLKKVQTYRNQQSDGPTFTEVADEWWEQHEPTLAVNTTKSYKPALTRAKEAFGVRRIREIQPTDVNKFLRDFIRKMSAAKKTAATQLMVLNLIFKYSVEMGHTQTNPARDITLPKNLTKTPRAMPSSEDIRKVKDSAGEPFGMFAYWVLYTGCRRGELQALTWEDADIKEGWIHINKTLYYDAGKAKIKEPKTESGVRDIPLLKKLAEKLEPGKGLIFPNKKGTYMTEWEFQKAWGDYAAAAGITCTPHGLRHAFTTMLFEAGIQPKDIQTIVGHAQLSTTMDIYTHIRAEQAKRVQTKLVNLDIDL